MPKSMNTMYSLSGKWPKGNASPREKKKEKEKYIWLSKFEI